jgi:hypothetical protein
MPRANRNKTPGLVQKTEKPVVPNRYSGLARLLHLNLMKNPEG